MRITLGLLILFLASTPSCCFVEKILQEFGLDKLTDECYDAFIQSPKIIVCKMNYNIQSIKYQFQDVSEYSTEHKRRYIKKLCVTMDKYKKCVYEKPKLKVNFTKIR